MQPSFPDRSTGAERPSTIRILIADDTSSSRELLRSILESSGYEVDEAEDGEQVLERAVSFLPHLIILDLKMPKLDGCSTARALRKISAFENIPIVALAAALPEVIPEQMTQAGITRCLVKPIGPARLRACVASLL